MLAEETLQKLIRQLVEQNAARVDFDGSNIAIHVLEDASKLLLTTPVYQGGNYIPFSVRRCLSHKSPFPHASIHTYLTIDETSFSVHLQYLDQLQLCLSSYHLKELLEEFGTIAERWRLYLDKHDKDDLVHVRIK